MARLHPSSVGPVAEHVGFRVWAAAADSWAISGEVDATCYDSFRRVIETIGQMDGTVTLDLQQLGFIDAADLGVISMVAA
jgi:hypothetical protein